MRYRNPVLPGLHPDPTACRVGDRFYLAVSSFHYFPGIPLFVSSDLVDWRLAGHAVSEAGQLDLSGAAASRGLFAPTLRHARGRFHLVCTQVDGLGNFLMSSPAIEGPWSPPISLPLGGIDPSLLFDDDGTVYLCAGGRTELGMGVTLSVVDLGEGRILEGPRLICRGSGGRWPEGPHLYRRKGLYYLFLAEGGTEYGHMETVFRSTSPWGPYEACPRNPILSHRDLPDEPIQCVGHGDLLEDAAGNSWFLCLGVRPLGPQLHNLGRETFLAPLSWDGDGWPQIGQEGRLSLEMEGPLPGVETRKSPTARCWKDEFLGPSISPEWTSVRSRPAGAAALAEGGLLLSGGPGLSEPFASPAFLGRPQSSFDCVFEAVLDFRPPHEGAEAGAAALYDDSCHYEAFVTRFSGRRVIRLRRRVNELEALSPPSPLPESGPVRLRIEADRERYLFSYDCVPESGVLGWGRTAGLCTEGTWRQTFTGVLLGLYCSGGGTARFEKASCVDRKET